MIVTRHGLPWRAISPSLYQMRDYPASIHYDGRAWLISIREVTGTREFPTRDDAAALIATTFSEASAACRY